MKHSVGISLISLWPAIQSVQAYPQAQQAEFQNCITQAVGGRTAAARLSTSANFQTQDVNGFNRDYRNTPLAVVYPESAQQVSRVVLCASRFGFKVQGRSGGHSYVNNGNGGVDSSTLGGVNGTITVDLKQNFQQYSYDSNTQVATVGPGNTLEIITRKNWEAGRRAMPYGVAPTIGIGGHATIGGIGPLSRMHGLALDQIQECEVVLANGTIVRASSNQNADLFFAIRGAGGSFGIVTEFKFKTHPAPTNIVNLSFITNSNDSIPLARTFKAFQNVMGAASTPRELTMNAVIRSNMVIVSGSFYGSRSQFNLLGLENIFNMTTSRTVSEETDWSRQVKSTGDGINAAYGQRDGARTPIHMYAKDAVITNRQPMSDATVDQLFNYIRSNSPSNTNFFVVADGQGGQTNTVAKNATAFVHRDALYHLHAYSISQNQNTQETYKFMDRVLEIAKDGVKRTSYVGYADPRMEGSAQEAYWGENLQRLKQLKGQYDPTDLFSLPQGVKP